MTTAWRRWAAFSWLLLAACNSPAKKELTEGTRLKAVYQEVGGAPPRFVGWYDTVLGLDCAFGDAGGVPDRLVCFPTNPPELPGFNMIFGVPSSYVTPDGDAYAPLQFILDDKGVLAIGPKPEDPCGTPIKLFALGPEITDRASIYVKDSEGQIAPLDPSAELPRGLHRVGAEIPLDTLVTGAYKPGAGSGRIVPLTIVASDGSIQPAGTRGEIHTRNGGEEYPGVFSHFVAWDKERSEMVRAYYAEQYQEGLRWYPEPDTSNWGFADDACTVPIAIGPACSFRARAAVASWDSGGPCEPSTPSFVEVGAEVARAPLYQGGGQQACTPLPDEHNPAVNHALTGYATGAPIPSTAFAAATQVRAGTKQVQVVEASSGGAGLYPVGFFDTVHGVPCGPRGPDQPCLPTAIEARGDASSVFSDAACSIPLVAFDLPCVSKEKAFISRTEQDPPWDGRGPLSFGLRHIYALGERYRGPMYSMLSGPCALIGSDVPTDQWELFEIGAEIPQSDFAMIKLVRPE